MAKYLLLYNASSCLLWLYMLISLITTTTPYPTIEPYTRWTQTLSIAEIVHAATGSSHLLSLNLNLYSYSTEELIVLIGITRAPVSTTFIQIFTRCVQVWAIDHGYPELFTASASASAGLELLAPASVYAAMVFAWSLADVVRYAYFVVLLAGLGMPGWLKWLRYSHFPLINIYTDQKETDC